MSIYNPRCPVCYGATFCHTQGPHLGGGVFSCISPKCCTFEWNIQTGYTNPEEWVEERTKFLYALEAQESPIVFPPEVYCVPDREQKMKDLVQKRRQRWIQIIHENPEWHTQSKFLTASYKGVCGACIWGYAGLVFGEEESLCTEYKDVCALRSHLCDWTAANPRVVLYQFMGMNQKSGLSLVKDNDRGFSLDTLVSTIQRAPVFLP